MEYYVYVYLDPKTMVVRYVGAGPMDRMRVHTLPENINKSNSPFYQWLRKQEEIYLYMDWDSCREIVAGPFNTRKEARAAAQIWIEEWKETTLNFLDLVG